MADPLHNRDPIARDPRNPADPADPRHAANDPRIVDPATGAARPSDTVVVDNTGRSGGSNVLVIGVVAAAIVVALLVFMNWSPGTDTATDPGGAVIEEPAATAPAGDATAPAAEAPAADTAPAPADEAPADTAPATEPAE
ncbi:hypothetical protein PZ895_06645 [Mesorhizobium sp. YIM 152430]|uniref:hypothetical protein n=1 Tax=Mesorhizobium sp. YIM 152430 TaxID=3031761 RepID=UPI0023D9D5CF|nr:hypothetical protein [Mesorhizobium sp. YIM 152430]MDF1599456.1 hypothetical protein [Mesorhizobium sp. YIM 152430]